MTCPTPHKKHFPSETVARNFATVVAWKTQTPLRVYQCGDHWHFTRRNARGTMSVQPLRNVGRSV